MGMNAWLAAGLLAGATFGKEPAVLRSGPGRVVLLELFTSEGCSSCPSADAWLSGLEGAPGLWAAYVPVGFHVTYWDRLGWPDPWGAKAYTDRQRRHADRWGPYRVYTPGFVTAGVESRPERLPERPGESVGTLEARAAGSRLSVTFSPTSRGTRAVKAFCAPLGIGLESRVRAGENEGRTLRHAFTALGLAEAPLKCEKSTCSAELDVPPPAARAPKTALAVWVEAADGTPLQAAGGLWP